jgi:hypothetical protein
MAFLPAPLRVLCASAYLCANAFFLSIAASACSPRTPDAVTVVAPSPDSLAHEVVRVLSRRDIDSLAKLAHPTKGIRFTPYTRVDSKTDRRFTPSELRTQWPKPDSLLWGTFDGSGDPMRLSFRQYFDKFVYDFDFARAPRVARDSATMGNGNSIYNLKEAYPGATIVEFNSPGADPKYGGMDWRSLWVVLEKLDSRWVVVGLVHGSWTS